jgi:DNA-directed RNA polymerase sigma subunit (sigma70/sigma32)
MAEDLSNHLELYLRELPDIRLSRKEERQLIHQIQQGEEAKQRLLAKPLVNRQNRQKLERKAALGRRAQDRLVCAHLKLVVRIAFSRRFQQARLSPLDRIQTGNEALMYFAKRFPADLNIRFTTYVWSRVSKAIQKTENAERLQAGYRPLRARRYKGSLRSQTKDKE